jgi:hypothetical protein
MRKSMKIMTTLVLSLAVGSSVALAQFTPVQQNTSPVSGSFFGNSGNAGGFVASPQQTLGQQPAWSTGGNNCGLLRTDNSRMVNGALVPPQQPAGFPHIGN